MAPSGACPTARPTPRLSPREIVGLSDPSCALRIAYPCAAVPVPATPGRADRPRLNRGGDRQADDAPRTTVLARTRYDRRTRDHLAGRAAEGTPEKRIVRCLKRFVVRDAYKHLPQPGIATEQLLPTA